MSLTQVREGRHRGYQDMGDHDRTSQPIVDESVHYNNRPVTQPGSQSYPSPHSRENQFLRLLWGIVWLLAYRPSPKPFHGWRRFLLRLFGAKIASNAYPHPSVKVWAPWNLEMGPLSCLGPYVDCYSVDRVVIGPRVCISQYSFLCTATHDYHVPDRPLVTSPIVIGERAWVAADVFVGPGVTIGEGAIVGARASVFRDVAPWTVVGGNPARMIRKYRPEPEQS